jgi:hypothetical protein
LRTALQGRGWSSDRDVARGASGNRKTLDLNDSSGEDLRGFPRQIVPHAIRDDPVGVIARLHG